MMNTPNSFPQWVCVYWRDKQYRNHYLIQCPGMSTAKKRNRTNGHWADVWKAVYKSRPSHLLEMIQDWAAWKPRGHLAWHTGEWARRLACLDCADGERAAGSGIVMEVRVWMLDLIGYARSCFILSDLECFWRTLIWVITWLDFTF